MSSKTIPEKPKPANKEEPEDKSQNGHANGTTNGSNEDNFATHPRFSRLREKIALVGLNNRLASIIDRNRQLENENMQLTAEVKHTEEKLQSVSRSIKTTFETQNTGIRKELDNLEKEKAKLVLSENNVRSKLKEAEEKLKKRDTENAKLQKDLTDAKAKTVKTEEELQKEKDKVAKISKEKAEVEDDNKKLRQENEDFKKFNEEHLMIQVDLKNALKTKNEELTLKAQVHEREIQAVAVKSETFLHKISEKAKKEFEKKLADAIAALRKDCEVQLEVNKKEQDQLHQLKEADYKLQIGRLSESLKIKGEEMVEISVQVEKCSVRIAELEGDKHSLEQKVKGAEEKLGKSEGKFLKEILELQKHLKDLQDDRTKLIGEYQDLMEIKVALDNEISTYRILLEGEEDRLQIFYEESTKQTFSAEAQKAAESAFKKEVVVQL